MEIIKNLNGYNIFDKSKGITILYISDNYKNKKQVNYLDKIYEPFGYNYITKNQLRYLKSL